MWISGGAYWPELSRPGSSTELRYHTERRCAEERATASVAGTALLLRQALLGALSFLQVAAARGR